MRLPGSKIEVTFENELVILRDENTSKVIDIGGLTFEDILSEVQSFAYIRNCRPARRLLRFILLRSGLPDQEEFPRRDILNEEDLNILETALESVGDLSDRFLSPHSSQKHETEQPEAEQCSEVEETPVFEIPQSERASIWTSDREIDLVYSFSPENIPTKTPETISPVTETTGLDEPIYMRIPMFDESSSTGLTRLKVLFLGESGVGKQSILQNGGFSIYESAVFGSLQTDEPLAYSKVVEHQAEQIRIDVWLPEGALQARIPVEELYSETGVIALVYSVSDRSSFERMQFWIEEASTMFLTPPPLIIIGNKKDLASSLESDNVFDNRFVSSEEGIELTEMVASKLAAPDSNFPVKFIEISAMNHDSIERAVDSIIRLWLENDKLILPIVELPV